MLKIPAPALLASILLLLCTPNSLWAAEYSLLSTSVAPELASSEGYMLLYVDAGGSAPSFEFARISKADSEPLPAGERFRFATSPHKINLKGLAKGFYLLPMTKGQYQITRVNAPHYSFPFRMDTDNRPEWRFVIEPGKTNYIGALHINSERSTSNVEIDLLNRIAMQEPAIRALMGDALNSYPLEFHAGYRDDFYRQIPGARHAEVAQ
jgi:hypothetical protein